MESNQVILSTSSSQIFDGFLMHLGTIPCLNTTNLPSRWQYGKTDRMGLFPEANQESGELELRHSSAISRWSGFMSHSLIWVSLSSSVT